MNVRAIPCQADPGLLWHADLMRQQLCQILFGDLPRHAQLRAYHQTMGILVTRGELLAVDCTLDIAYIQLDDPAVFPGLVTLDEAALAARIRDMLAMRSRMLN